MQDFRYEVVFESGERVRLGEISNVDNREAADKMALEMAQVVTFDYPGKPFKVVEYMPVFREAMTGEWLTAPDAYDPAPPIMVPERWRRTTLLRQVAGDYMHDRPALTHNLAVQGLIEAIIEAVNASEVGNAKDS